MMKDDNKEACVAAYGKQGKLLTQKVDWKAGHKGECKNNDETNDNDTSTNAIIKAADETTTTTTTAAVAEAAAVDEKTRRAHTLNDETLRQSKTQKTENTGGSDDDDVDDDNIGEPSSFKAVRRRIEKGDKAFKNEKYDDAKDAYDSAWRVLHIIMSRGEDLSEEEEESEDDDDDDDDDDYDDDDIINDDFDDLEPPMETKEKCLKEFSVVFTKLGEYHAIRNKDWDQVSAYATMALEHDATNQDAVYLMAKSQYYDKQLLLAMEYAELMVRDDERGIKLVKTIQSFLLSVIDKKRDLFRRIIDSYRLRVDDEAVQCVYTNELCQHNIYGLRAQGIRAVPLKHFRAYLHMGQHRNVLPEYLLPENGTVKYQALMYMAATDDWFNIGFATDHSRIRAYYRMIQAVDSVESLRSFAVEIAGPIQSLDQKDDIMDYISDDEDEDDDEDVMTLTEQMHAAMNARHKDATD